MNIFWEKAARRSGRFFVFLVAVAISISALIFFDLEKNVRFADSAENKPLIKETFNAAAAAKYRQTFAEIARREENYRRAKESLYPDIFFVPAKSGVILETDLTSVPEEADGLTEPQN